MAAATDNIDYKDFFAKYHNPHMIMKADEKLTIIAHNEAHAKIGMVKHNSIVGMPFLEAFPDTTEEYKKTGISSLIESMKKVIRTGEAETLPLIHYDIKDKNGTLIEKWWRATHYPMFDDSGKVHMIYQNTEDVSSEVQAQAEVARMDAMLQSVQDLGIVSNYSWDMKEDVVVGDANLARTFGVSVQEAQSGLPIQTFIESIHPDDSAEVNEAITSAINNGTAYKIDYRTIRADKTIDWVTAVGKVISDEKGVPRYFNGILIDITDRKKIENRLAQSEQRFKALFDSTIAGIATVRTNGDVLQANPLFLNLFGYTKSDLKRGLINSASLSAIADDPVSKGIYESLKLSGQSPPVKKQYKRKDNSTFTGLVGAAMLPESDDEFVAFVIDVTETEKLKELNLVKNEFIAMASHQLRTPASTVKQYLGILIDGYAGTLNADQFEYAKVANSANDREIQIIEDLLKTAQIDVKGYELKLAPINVIKVIKDVCKHYEPMLSGKKQRCTIRNDKAVIIIRADETELSTCIANLIENASKYSAEGKAIKVSVKQSKKSCRIVISDQGVGIKEEDYAKIFDKFTRVDNPFSDTVTGSGLGLYWVKRIVELHKGSLAINSEIGKGTSFTIELPL